MGNSRIADVFPSGVLFREFHEIEVFVHIKQIVQKYAEIRNRRFRGIRGLCDDPGDKRIVREGQTPSQDFCEIDKQDCRVADILIGVLPGIDKDSVPVFPGVGLIERVI